MVDLLSGEALELRLNKLTRKCHSIDVAVAWATLWSGTKGLLKLAKENKVALRLLIGVGGYITDPRHIEEFAKHADLRIYGTATGKLFHPKLYVFRTKLGTTCWVGSSNLTHSAFHTNLEAVAQFADTDGIGQQQFNRLWDSAESVPFEKFDLAGYRSKRLELASTIGPELANSMELASPAPVEDVLRGGWSTYAQELRLVRPDVGAGFDLNKWLNVLDHRGPFINRNWSDDLTVDDLKIMFGKNPYAPFGRLYAINEKKFRGSQGKQSRMAIGRALQTVQKMIKFEAGQVEAVFDDLLHIDGLGNSLVTRLFVLTRPDWFVVANKKSLAGLSAMFGLPLNNLTPKVYVDLLGRIQAQPWFQSTEPSDSQEQRWWKYRTALIDPLVYNGNDPAVFADDEDHDDDLD